MTTAPGPYARSEIDPRLRARRIAVRRHEGRRRLRRLSIGLGVVALAGAIFAVVHSPLLDVDAVRVSGAANAGSERIVHASGLETDRPLLLVDLAEARHRIEEVPWVAQARLRRAWPGAVEIDVVERQAVAAAPATEDRWALVDLDGRVLAVVDEAPPELPRADGIGPAGSPGEIVDSEGVVTIAAQLPSALRPRVAAVTRDRAGEVVLALRAGDGAAEDISVRIGPPTDVAAKVAALEALVQALDDPETVAVIDVRVPTAPTLTRRDGSA